MSDNKKTVKASGSKLRSGNRRFTSEEVNLVQERLRLQRALARSSRNLPKPKNLDPILANYQKSTTITLPLNPVQIQTPNIEHFQLPLAIKHY